MEPPAEHAVSAVAGWLPPAEALTRFSLPIDASLPTSGRVEAEIARYGFRVGGLDLLIAAGTPSEVVARGQLAPIPRGPAWLLGMMNLRGHPVPVFDLALALGLASDTTAAGSKVLVLDRGERALGIEIDAFPVAVRRPQPAGTPSLPARLGPFVRRAFRNDNGLWLDFDHGGFFTQMAST